MLALNNLITKFIIAHQIEQANRQKQQKQKSLDLLKQPQYINQQNKSAQFIHKYNQKMSTLQQQIAKKQMILNIFVDKLMELKQTKITKVPMSNMCSIPKVDVNFMQLFDLIIWLQKKKPQTLQNIIQMDVLILAINMISLDELTVQIKSVILLINNCKINGDIIMNLLVNGLVDKIIVKYIKSIEMSKAKGNVDLDESLEYLGSLLKAYNNHLNEKTYMYFLNNKVFIDEQSTRNKQIQIKQSLANKNCDPNDIFNTCDQSLQQLNQIHSQKLLQPRQCLLLKVCSRFYNCPQQLTRTTVLNILMSILKKPFAKELVYDIKTNEIKSFMKELSHNLCAQFRNQLKNFNQQLMQDLFLQQLNDKVIFWQDLTQLEMPELYAYNFLHEVIYSLVIGSLNTSSLPMFNIKFTFFILAKLMKVCSNINLLNQIGSMLFVKQSLIYDESWVSTAVLKGFDLDNVLNDEYFQVNHKQQQQMNKFSGVNQFFLNMLKSKDQHFQQISANMLQQMLFHVRKNQKSLQYFTNTLQFGENGRSLITTSSVMIGQLKFDHSLTNLKRICQTLIFLHPKKRLSQENSNQFVYFYSNYLSETLDLLEKGQKHWNYIVEAFEYDMKILDLIKFLPKALKDKDLLIHPTENQDHTSGESIKEDQQYKQNSQQCSFYNLIPETPSQVLRYRIVKTFLLLKFKELIIESKQSDSILTRYVQKLKNWQSKQLKPGDQIPYPLKQKFYQCKLIEQKTQIPCLIIEDDVNLIVGFVESNFVKIIINVKIKHIESEIYVKKEKPYVKLSFFKFDFGCQNIVPKSSVLIRGFETAVHYLSVKKENFKEKQLNSIRKGLRKTVENLPQISLL